MSACGLDFGTSNTTLGIETSAGPALVALEEGSVTIPSAIFYGADGSTTVGREAIRRYVDGHDGRLMRSLKSVLGSSLIEEVTQLGKHRLRFREVIAAFLGTVKRRAETAAGRGLDKVVHGRPVFFVDNNPAADVKAEEALRRIAGKIGFAEISFQYEPIAAALDYERQVSHEELALIADIGGGTSDFSIVRLSPERHRKSDRSEDILANDGVRIGGTDFDRQLSLNTLMPLLGHRSAMKRPGLTVPSAYFHDLATWSSINRMYRSATLRDIREVRREAAEPHLLDRLMKVVESHRGHSIVMEIEEAKISLSEKERARLDLSFVEPGLGVDIDRPGLVGHTLSLAERIVARIDTCLAQAGLSADAIDAVFMTGGSTKLAHVRAAIIAALPDARIVEGDTFGSVGTGLAIEAARRYGAIR
jgi:hypothetical chaperone protein